MIPITHLLFEIISYILFFVCAHHAYKQIGRRKERFAILVTGTVYGVLLETMTIYQLHAYVYGDFLIMFNGEVPLVIGVGWGIILYSVIAIADALKLSYAAWIGTVGLLGLAIDMTMDVVAVRTGMWNWYLKNSLHGVFMGPSEDWFGVTWGNYFAWFIVLTSAAAFFRLYNINGSKSVFTVMLKSLGVIVSSLVVLGTLDGLYFAYANHQWWPIAVEVSAAIGVIAYSITKKGGSVRCPYAINGLPSRAVPTFFHLYFSAVMVWGIVNPAIITRPEMREFYVSQVSLFASVAIVLAGITFLVHKTAVEQKSKAKRTATLLKECVK